MKRLSDDQLAAFIGRRNGKLKVVHVFRADGEIIFDCRCNCGVIRTVRKDSFLRGSPASCPACRVWLQPHAATEEEMVGTQFEHLVVVGLADVDEGRNRLWLVVCECGNTRLAKTAALRSRQVKSCGRCGHGRGSRR